MRPGPSATVATVLRWDGRSWTKVPVPTQVNLHGVGSLGAGGLWVVGARGTFLRYDGARWTEEARPRLGRLKTVLELAPDDAWAASEGGRVLHFDGRSWTSLVAAGPLARLPAFGLLAAWARAPDDIWFAGRDLLHWDGRAFAALDLSGDAIWGAGARDVWLVGQNGFVRRFDGKGWAYAPKPTENALLGVWGSGPDDVWIVGEQGTLLHHDGHAWSGGATEAPLATGAIWGTAASAGRSAGQRRRCTGRPARGDPGQVARRRWQGAPWLAAVYGSADDDLWGVDGNGDAHHWNGQTWTHAHSTIPQDAKAIWSSGPDDVWICGGYDGLAHFDGKAWSRQPNPYPETVPGRANWFGLWGTSRRDLWLAGDRSNEAALYHFDGRRWTAAAIPRLPPSTTLYAIAGSDRDHVWAVGRTYDKGSVVLRREGTRWSLQTPPGHPLARRGVGPRPARRLGGRSRGRRRPLRRPALAEAGRRHQRGLHRRVGRRRARLDRRAERGALARKPAPLTLTSLKRIPPVLAPGDRLRRRGDRRCRGRLRRRGDHLGRHPVGDGPLARRGRGQPHRRARVRARFAGDTRVIRGARGRSGHRSNRRTRAPKQPAQRALKQPAQRALKQPAQPPAPEVAPVAEVARAPGVARWRKLHEHRSRDGGLRGARRPDERWCRRPTRTHAREVRPADEPHQHDAERRPTPARRRGGRWLQHRARGGRFAAVARGIVADGDPPGVVQPGGRGGGPRRRGTVGPPVSRSALTTSGKVVVTLRVRPLPLPSTSISSAAPAVAFQAA